MTSPPGFLQPPAPYMMSPWGVPTGSSSASVRVEMGSSPPPEEMGSVEDFCTRYRLGESVRTKLGDLGFEIGDDLSMLKDSHWQSMGFAPLEWNRILKAYNNYKRFLRDGQ